MAKIMGFGFIILIILGVRSPALLIPTKMSAPFRLSSSPPFTFLFYSSVLRVSFMFIQTGPAFVDGTFESTEN